MSKQKILTVPNPLLRQKSKPVQKIDKKIQKIVRDLKDTLKIEEGPQGVGLAAPQIGQPYRLCLVFSKKSKKFLTLINPEIIWKSKAMVNRVPESKNPYEGCLSVPGYWGLVKRYKEIKVCYFTEGGKKVTRKFSGFTATVAQHEIDHLDGILFIDRILEQKSKLYKLEKGKDGKEIFREVEIT